MVWVLISLDKDHWGLRVKRHRISCTNAAPIGIISTASRIYRHFLNKSCSTETMQKITHLLFLDGFKDLDNAFLIVSNI